MPDQIVKKTQIKIFSNHSVSYNDSISKIKIELHLSNMEYARNSTIESSPVYDLLKEERLQCMAGKVMYMQRKICIISLQCLLHTAQTLTQITLPDLTD